MWGLLLGLAVFRVSIYLSRMLRTGLRISLLALTLAPAPLLSQDPLEEAAEAVAALENRQMQRLAAQQNRPGIFISEFNSDGCSGGMSEVWSNLSDVSPTLPARR